MPMLRQRRPLTMDALRLMVPSAFAGTRYGPSTSERYVHIRTVDVVDALCTAGFVPVAAQQQRSRVERQPFTRHAITFQHPGDVGSSRQLGGLFPEVLVVNGHDGSSSFRLVAAIYRLVCRNGLMIADTTLAAIRVRHTGHAVAAVVANAHAMIERLPAVITALDAWRGVVLSAHEQRAFAARALTLRYGERVAPIACDALLGVRRAGDVGNDLWCVFNRVQENLLYGVRGPGPQGVRTMRTLTAIGERVRVGTALWELASEIVHAQARDARVEVV